MAAMEWDQAWALGFLGVVAVGAWVAAWVALGVPGVPLIYPEGLSYLDGRQIVCVIVAAL